MFETVPPSWVMRPADLEAVVGHLVELPCSADGSPKPSITWKKEIGLLILISNDLEQWCPTTFSLSPHSPQL